MGDYYYGTRTEYGYRDVRYEKISNPEREILRAIEDSERVVKRFTGWRDFSIFLTVIAVALTVIGGIGIFQGLTLGLGIPLMVLSIVAAVVMETVRVEQTNVLRKHRRDHEDYIDFEHQRKEKEGKL